MTTRKHIVYITRYSGTKLPPFYIGSSYEEKVNKTMVIMVLYLLKNIEKYILKSKEKTKLYLKQGY